MSDMMTFPATVEEFMEQYKIVDDEKVYTNGADLVPIFRMMQWLEHVSATDTISRQAAIMDAESWVAVDEYEKHLQKNVVEWLKEFPPAELGTNSAEVGIREVIGYPIDADALMEKVAEEYGERARDRLYQIIRYMPPAQPEPNYDEWCTDCKEYDHENSCCPRWTKVIRQTRRELQDEFVMTAVDGTLWVTVDDVQKVGRVIVDEEKSKFCRQFYMDAKPEQRTGKWIDGHCSECGTHAPYWAMASTYHRSNFCPNCGAKMGRR